MSDWDDRARAIGQPRRPRRLALRSEALLDWVIVLALLAIVVGGGSPPLTS